MYETIEFEIKGLAPCLMHNGQLSDPLNEYAQAIKKVTSKRKKTEEDQIEIGRLEFLGSFYLDAELRPCWPGENIEAAIAGAAKKLKLGKAFKSAIFCPGTWPLIYKGPKDRDSLWADKRFVDRRRAKVGTSAVMRTRPRFDDWSLKFSINFMADQVDRDQILQVVRILGKEIGLSDYTPRFGRFEVVTPAA